MPRAAQHRLATAQHCPSGQAPPAPCPLPLPCHTPSQGCLEDSDCAGDLVCLYSHQLLSLLDYISGTDSRAFTCGR